MTAYTTVSNALVAVGAKPFATTVQALRDNPIAIAEADASVPANLLPSVLLGTITTTSGASQTLSGLVLTQYRFLRLVFNGVSATGAATMTLAGINLTTIAASSTVAGIIDIELSGGRGGGVLGLTTGGTMVQVADSFGIVNATTSITVALSAVAFDAGNVRFWGIK